MSDVTQIQFFLGANAAGGLFPYMTGGWTSENSRPFIA